MGKIRKRLSIILCLFLILSLGNSGLTVLSAELYQGSDILYQDAKITSDEQRGLFSSMQEIYTLSDNKCEVQKTIKILCLTPTPKPTTKPCPTATPKPTVIPCPTATPKPTVSTTKCYTRDLTTSDSKVTPDWNDTSYLLLRIWLHYVASWNGNHFI